VAKIYHFIGSARLISVLTLLSRILGLIRDAVCLRYFGTAVWHYFSVPFQIPNLFRRLFGEGALSAALIPVYSEQQQKDPQNAGILARVVVTLLFVLLSVITLLGLVLIYLLWLVSSHKYETWLVLSLAALMLPYMILICSVATIGGLLNVHRHFTAPAAAPIVLNVCIITTVIWLRDLFGQTPWEQIFGVAAAVLVAGVLQLLMQFPACRRAGISLKPRLHRSDFSNPALRKIVRLMIPMLLGLSVIQINTLLDSLMAYFLSGTEAAASFTVLGHTIEYPVREGSVAYLYCAARLYHFPLGVFGMALATAVFPWLSRHAAEKDFAAFGDTLAQALRMIAFIALPATVGLILIRRPLIEVIFAGGSSAFTAEDTARVAWTMLFYVLGLGAYCLQQVVVRGFYSFQDSVTPVKIAVRMVGLNFILNLILIWPLKTGGLALSTALCAAVQSSILLIILIRRYQLQITSGLFVTLGKTAIAVIFMVGGGWWSLQVLREFGSLVQLLASVSLCAAIFGLVSVILKNSELYALLHRHKL